MLGEHNKNIQATDGIKELNSARGRDSGEMDLHHVAEEESDALCKGITKMMEESNGDQVEEGHTIIRRKSTLIFDDEQDDARTNNGYETKYNVDTKGTTFDEKSLPESDESSQEDENVNSSQMKDLEPSAISDTMSAGNDRKSHNKKVSVRPSKNTEKMVMVDITWDQGGEKVYVTGTFTNWRKMIGLVPIPDKPGKLHIRLKLNPGTHKFRFVVDNELRYSDSLPTATDEVGNFVNYLEVSAPEPKEISSLSQRPSFKDLSEQEKKMKLQSCIALNIRTEPDDLGGGFSRYYDEEPSKPRQEYIHKIPAVFIEPKSMDEYYHVLSRNKNKNDMAWLTPPQLPPHLDNVILNAYRNQPEGNDEDNGGTLPIPNHAILNHLATTSIKNHTLSVAQTIRYKQKYVSQVYYSPIQ